MDSKAQDDKVAAPASALLRECPFCGNSDPARLKQERWSRDPHAWLDTWEAVECMNCRANAPAKAWNRRAHLAAGRGEGWVSVPVEVWAECLEVISEAAGGWDRQARQLDKKLTAAQYENKP